ncbi:MAG: polymer-forming cytoskeletal protein, partial [bacterium]|nr:polymer-forming cytoskeletal protein [bacterium]
MINFINKNMFGDNKNKLIKLVAEKSTIGADFTVEGLVNSPGEVELNGSVKGPVNVKVLCIKEKGSVIGEINAERVEVNGYVDGT